MCGLVAMRPTATSHRERVQPRHLWRISKKTGDAMRLYVAIRPFLLAEGNAANPHGPKTHSQPKTQARAALPRTAVSTGREKVVSDLEKVEDSGFKHPNQVLQLARHSAKSARP